MNACNWRITSPAALSPCIHHRPSSACTARNPASLPPQPQQRNALCTTPKRASIIRLGVSLPSHPGCEIPSKKLRSAALLYYFFPSIYTSRFDSWRFIFGAPLFHLSFVDSHPFFSLRENHRVAFGPKHASASWCDWLLIKDGEKKTLISGCHFFSGTNEREKNGEGRSLKWSNHAIWG